MFWELALINMAVFEQDPEQLPKKQYKKEKNYA